MGLILDSSVIISAERRGDSADQLILQVTAMTGDDEAALTAVGLTEIVHGLYRAKGQAVMERRKRFLNDLLAGMPVHSYTRDVAMLAGRIDGEQASVGNIIPFADLLIGATALSLGFSVLTKNLRDFRRIPGLNVIAF